MKAGKELDTLVCEMVLDKPREMLKNGFDDANKSYSTDASAMWDIINIFVKKDFSYTITNTNQYEHSCIFDSIVSHKRYIAHSDSLAEAVCKAALMAALGEEQHKIKMQ